MERAPSPIHGFGIFQVILEARSLEYMHPWYLLVYGFGPWYGSKGHCNSVIKRLNAFLIKHLRIFGILHFSYSIELLGYLFWVPFLVQFERWGSKNTLWASPLHMAYILYVSMSRIFTSYISLMWFSHSCSIMIF